MHVCACQLYVMCVFAIQGIKSYLWMVVKGKGCDIQVGAVDVYMYCMQAYVHAPTC